MRQEEVPRSLECGEREEVRKAAREVLTLNLYHIYSHENHQASFILKTKTTFSTTSIIQKGKFFKSFLAKCLTKYNNRANEKHSGRLPSRSFLGQQVSKASPQNRCMKITYRHTRCTRTPTPNPTPTIQTAWV